MNDYIKSVTPILLSIISGIVSYLVSTNKAKKEIEIKAFEIQKNAEKEIELLREKHAANLEVLAKNQESIFIEKFMEDPEKWLNLVEKFDKKPNQFRRKK